MTAKVIICGAGQVGYNVARYLSHYDVNVTCIDKERDLITRLSEKLDIQGICGSASHPEVLERAGVRDADVFLAVTQVDEVNMVACEIAHALFNVGTKIARIRNKAYFNPRWQRIFDPGNLSVDVIISPELEVAKSISQSLEVPGAFAIYTLCDGRIRIVGVKCNLETPVINTPITHIASLFPHVEMVVLGIIRGDQHIIPTEEEILRNGDEVYFCCETFVVDKAMQAFVSNIDQSCRVMILGGGNIGVSLAQEIETHYPKASLRIIERDKRQAEEITNELQNTVVLRGDALDSEILKEAGVGSTDMVVAVTDDDQVNTLAALLAKRHGAKYVQALINNRSYGSFVTSLGIDALINPRAITVSRILEHIRKGRVLRVHSIREGFGEVIEIEVHENSNLVGSKVEDISAPTEILISVILRDEKIIFPTPDIIIQNNDRLVMMVASHMIPKVEKMLSEQITYF